MKTKTQSSLSSRPRQTTTVATADFSKEHLVRKTTSRSSFAYAPWTIENWVSAYPAKIYFDPNFRPGIKQKCACRRKQWKNCAWSGRWSKNLHVWLCSRHMRAVVGYIYKNCTASCGQLPIGLQRINFCVRPDRIRQNLHDLGPNHKSWQRRGYRLQSK